MTQLSFLDTPWGVFAYAARDGRLVFTSLPEPSTKAERRAKSRLPEAVRCNDLLPQFREQVLRYFAGEPVEFTPDIDLSSCPAFHQRVLRACRKIPFGQTISYGGLATKAGHPGAARAVGQAMAANPLPLVIPCHRVVAANGRLGGFSSANGQREKVRLLRLEDPMFEPMPPASSPKPKRNPANRATHQCEDLFAGEVL